MSFTSSPSSRLRRLPWIVMALGLAFSFLSSYYVFRVSYARDQLRLDYEGDRILEGIKGRLEMYTAALSGIAGFFAGSEEVKAYEFYSYTSHLHPETLYPGVQGLGFARHVVPGERSALIGEMRLAGNVPSFQIYPEQDRDESYVITYLHPQDRRNKVAIGYDMFSEPVRREAMERARDTGQPCLTGKVTLVQEIDERKQAGFLAYVPVYQGAVSIASVDERRKLIIGFAYSPFRADDFLRNILGGEETRVVNFQLYDGTSLAPATLLHSSDASAFQSSSGSFAPDLQKELVFGGRTWTILVRPTPIFARESQLYRPLLLFIAGLFVTGALAAISSLTYRSYLDMLRVQDERARVLESERQARSELEQAARMKDEFLATLSHELRTPLNAILGWAQLIRRPGLPPENVAHGLEIVENNARAQSRIVDDLLDMNRIISGKLQLASEPVCLKPLIDRAIQTVSPIAQAKQVEIRTDYHSADDRMKGDPGRLQQIFWNLLANAVKFTPLGGIIVIAMRRHETDFEISVKDSGEGIRAEFLPYIFDPFRQSDAASTTRKHGGLGLGLAIVRQLVQLHGGCIVAQSAGPGMGATFIVKLPAGEPGASGSVSAGREGEISKHGTSGSSEDALVCLNGISALIIDDQEDALRFLALVLEQRGAAVCAARSSAEALEILSSRKVDVILSDIAMPAEDGYELIRKVRDLNPGDNGKTPAIAVTAFARPEDRAAALSRGFQGFIAKPLDSSLLVSMVEELLDQRALNPKPERLPLE